jgi:hypothetical protein
MITRRDLLVTGAGVGAVGATVDAAQGGDDTAVLNSMLGELREIRRSVSLEGTQAIQQIRSAQRNHVKNSGRFPEFIDVGYDVFNAVVDWLIAVRQPAQIDRIGERYSITFLLTTIVLRPDFQDNAVGHGYDK